jgi:hypothetical protein
MATENSIQSTFSRALGDLKRRGSNLLVVGGPAPAAHEAACVRLLGESAGSRERLVVLTDGSFDRTAVREGAFDGRVVTYPASTRGAAAATPAGDAPASPSLDGADTPRRVERRDLGELTATVEDELDAFGEVDPGGLRLCIDSLTPLVESHDRAELKRFLTAVGNRVRASHGMAHCHLPVSRDDPVVADIEPAFDAVVEVRDGADCPEQRWSVLAENVDSGWLAF